MGRAEIGEPREEQVVKRFVCMIWMVALVVGANLIQADEAIWMDGHSERVELISSNPNSLSPSTTKGPYYYQSENELRMRKLARGVANVGLCVGEIPNQIFQESYKTSPVTGIFVGTGKGVVKGAKRLMIGTWEVFTFFHPTRNYYAPYVEPEVVFQEYLH
jgi:putative exosortase-associated protein (TIGR04073 family)